MDSIRVSEAPDTGSIPVEATNFPEQDTKSFRSTYSTQPSNRNERRNYEGIQKSKGNDKRILQRVCGKEHSVRKHRYVCFRMPDLF
jgi:hypothetical protein